jgi:hypothetical protein
VRVVGQRLAVDDPTLQAKIRQYPNIGYNGEYLVVKRAGKQALESSRVELIPRPSERAFANAPEEPGAAQLANDGRGLDRPDPLSRPGYDGADVSRQSNRPAKGTGAGRLRSIGD